LEIVTNLRSVWAREDIDFTPWLFGNLDLLSEAIGVPLSGETTEHPVGPYRLDILARDPDDRAVAIENQVEPADHSHLGQLLLYAAHVNAATAVWISPRFRDEQRQALLWLNENTVDGIRFFGVELGVVRISDSPPAPVFNVVVRPNDLRKSDPIASASGSPSGGNADPSQTREFLDEVTRRLGETIPGFRKPTGSSYQSYVWFRSGPFGYFAVTFTRERKLRVEAYLDLLDAAATKALYDELVADRDRWESQLGFALDWDRLDAKRASRIFCSRDYNPGNAEAEDVEAALGWATERTVSLLTVLEPTLRERGAQIRARASAAGPSDTSEPRPGGG
jgi:hypothetical protein